MAAGIGPEIVLYDLACTKNVCFSPVVWRIRLMLNYKRIPYKTVFLEFTDIEPTLKALGVTFHESIPEDKRTMYTVPAIHHLPSNTHMMDSVPISQFLESTYPDPPVQLTSELGQNVEAQARDVLVSTVFLHSVMPRETKILSPQSAEYFQRTREAFLGKSFEDLLNVEKEDEEWAAVADGMRAVGELMRTHKAEGPFVLGARPSYTDFFVAGSMQCARVIDEGIFQRFVQYPGFKDIYEACQPYMERKD